MNIFVTSPNPKESAVCLPDKHVVKMPLECCQMLSIIASNEWGNGYGKLPKSDGTWYKTLRGAFRNHPCTKWAAHNEHNSRWLIEWGLHLCEEYEIRYKKIHACLIALLRALDIFPEGQSELATNFVRAMPDEYKFDQTIDTFTAYKKYLAHKPWVSGNYLKLPKRKPDWV